MQNVSHLFWLMLTFRCQRRQVFVGANMRPPRHMFPKAPCPARCVPPPGTRGIRETARPVPQDSALVCMPASNFTAYGCRLFLFKLVCTCAVKSALLAKVLCRLIFTWALNNQSSYSTAKTTQVSPSPDYSPKVTLTRRSILTKKGRVVKVAPDFCSQLCGKILLPQSDRLGPSTRI
jgi:hypothetical protein